MKTVLFTFLTMAVIIAIVTIQLAGLWQLAVWIFG